MGNEREPGLMDIFVNPMKVTVKQFFKSTFGKPTTVMYPLEKRESLHLSKVVNDLQLLH